MVVLVLECSSSEKFSKSFSNLSRKVVASFLSRYGPPPLLRVAWSSSSPRRMVQRFNLARTGLLVLSDTVIFVVRVSGGAVRTVLVHSCVGIAFSIIFCVLVLLLSLPQIVFCSVVSALSLACLPCCIISLAAPFLLSPSFPFLVIFPSSSLSPAQALLHVKYRVRSLAFASLTLHHRQSLQEYSSQPLSLALSL